MMSRYDHFYAETGDEARTPTKLTLRRAEARTPTLTLTGGSPNSNPTRALWRRWFQPHLRVRSDDHKAELTRNTSPPACYRKRSQPDTWFRVKRTTMDVTGT